MKMILPISFPNTRLHENLQPSFPMIYYFFINDHICPLIQGACNGFNNEM